MGKMTVIDYLTEYYAAERRIETIQEKIADMTDLRRHSDAEIKIDMEIELRKTRKYCKKFEEEILSYFTKQDINFMRDCFYKRLPDRYIQLRYKLNVTEYKKYRLNIYQKCRRLFKKIGICR